MGQSSSHLLSQESELSKHYSVDRFRKDENLTFLTLRTTGEHYLLREIIYNEEAEYFATLKKLEVRKALRSPYLTRLEKLEFFKEENLCSKYFKVYALWEFPGKTLAEEINDRALAKHPFSEAELRLMLLELCSGLSAFEESKQAHECLTTRTVLVGEEGVKVVKVVDPMCTNARPNLDVVFQKRSIRNVYLSPEQCQVIESQEYHPFSLESYYKSDVFIAAMLLLEAALLARQDDCYLHDSELIHWPLLHNRLLAVQSRYGPDLKAILEGMLAPAASQRTNWTEVIHRLNAINPIKFQSNPNVQKAQEPSFLRGSFIHFPQPLQHPQPVLNRPPPVANPNQIPRNSFTFSYNQANRDLITQIGSKRDEVRPLIKNRSIQRIEHIRPKIVTFTTENTQNIGSSCANNNMSDGYDNFMISVSHPPINKPNANTFETQFNSSTLVKAESPPIKQQHLLSPYINNFSEKKTSGVFCIDRYSEGKRYEGYKVDGKKEGEGKFYLDNKLCFEGSWKNDMMEGEGKLYYQSGALAYHGQFQHDRFHGLGKLYNQFPQKLQGGFNYENFEEVEEYWKVYEGRFEDDLKEGKGMLLFTNGQQFEGNFHKDSIEGEGVFTAKNGEIIRGKWVGNLLQRVLN